MRNDEVRGKLDAELAMIAEQAERAGRKWDGWNRTFWWLGVSVAGAGVVAGYVGSIESIAHGAIKPWMVSALTSAGAALEIIRRRTRWEELGNAYWAKYVDVIGLLRRVRFETDARKPEDPVRQILEDLEDSEDRFGMARDAVIRDRQRAPRD